MRLLILLHCIALVYHKSISSATDHGAKVFHHVLASFPGYLVAGTLSILHPRWILSLLLAYAQLPCYIHLSHLANDSAHF